MTIQEWLNKSSFNREVLIRFHCHGVRLEIREKWETLVSVVEANIDLAWTEALRSLPSAKQRRAKENIAKYQSSIDDLKKEINKYKRSIKECQGLLPSKITPIKKNTCNKLVE